MTWRMEISAKGEDVDIIMTMTIFRSTGTPDPNHLQVDLILTTFKSSGQPNHGNFQRPNPDSLQVFR